MSIITRNRFYERPSPSLMVTLHTNPFLYRDRIVDCYMNTSRCRSARRAGVMLLRQTMHVPFQCQATASTEHRRIITHGHNYSSGDRTRVTERPDLCAIRWNASSRISKCCPYASLAILEHFLNHLLRVGPCLFPIVYCSSASMRTTSPRTKSICCLTSTWVPVGSDSLLRIGVWRRASATLREEFSRCVAISLKDRPPERLFAISAKVSLPNMGGM